jgi:hypothetical protein
MAALLPSILLPAPISLVPQVGSAPAGCWSSQPRRGTRQNAGRPGGMGGGVGTRSGVPLFLAAVLVAAALLVAPERPHDQEAICHRHRGELACRVW